MQKTVLIAAVSGVCFGQGYMYQVPTTATTSSAQTNMATPAVPAQTSSTISPKSASTTQTTTVGTVTSSKLVPTDSSTTKLFTSTIPTAAPTYAPTSPSITTIATPIVTIVDGDSLIDFHAPFQIVPNPQPIITLSSPKQKESTVPINPDVVEDCEDEYEDDFEEDCDELTVITPVSVTTTVKSEQPKVTYDTKIIPKSGLYYGDAPLTTSAPIATGTVYKNGLYFDDAIEKSYKQDNSAQHMISSNTLKSLSNPVLYLTFILAFAAL
ncbi:hypothetical protein BC833DRAFT_566915 [Globomyces pollinis-pini]|nr:hypothetical protein BC833DRAFT_566915 [Globomyces pollinis-pini]